MKRLGIYSALYKVCVMRLSNYYSYESEGKDSAAFLRSAVRGAR